MGDIVRLILGAGIRMTLIGAVLGLLGTAILNRLLANAMPGLATDNTAEIAWATVLLIVFALIACVVPARRAARVDPIVALRCD
jgi:ABC-type antimicrobial peptide transport system permease subunit